MVDLSHVERDEGINSEQKKTELSTAAVLTK
jgi:hypothetical protein